MQAVAKVRPRKCFLAVILCTHRDAWNRVARMYVPISACCTENSNMVHWRLSATNDDAGDYYSDTSDKRRNVGRYWENLGESLRSINRSFFYYSRTFRHSRIQHENIMMWISSKYYVVVKWKNIYIYICIYKDFIGIKGK